MAKFKCRQRVRLVRPSKRKEMTGAEGVLVVWVDYLGMWEVRFDKYPGAWASYEWELEPLLPDSDTYHPANISIDGLMRGLKERETA